ncbi:MAG: hypothetical protein K2M64_02845 [Clostridia bacterium]|nr:hypothetical protein [Clostridia bacterium]
MFGAKKDNSTGFVHEYPWVNAQYNSKKGSEYQPKLNAAYDANAYIADFVLIQDASFVKTLSDEKFLLSYVPQGDEFKFDTEDTQPMVGVTFNKVFMQNSTGTGFNKLENVWQLTGVDSADGKLKAVPLSYQSPLGEDINLNFLIMMTSPEACKLLTSAYKTYFGKDYDPTDATNSKYVNIGYQFVEAYIKSVTASGTWHGSDTDEVKAIGGYTDGHAVFAGLCKFKDYPGYTQEKAEANNVPYFKDGMAIGGYNNTIEGFNGFIYNMYALIPSTAKLPYTACLFVRYILTSEGYAEGWGGVPGYYSANQNIATVEGDPALATWKTTCLVEDADYINSAFNTANKFINKALSGK